jgi:hypothetical protein
MTRAVGMDTNTCLIHLLVKRNLIIIENPTAVSPDKPTPINICLIN